VSGLVDQALDAYVASMGTRGIDPQGVRVGTLAALVGVSNPRMSALLQDYRVRQNGGGTKYVVGCEGYGNPDTSTNPPRWKILSRPNSDPVVVQRARRDHAIYLARDMQTRLVRDFICEVYPALQGAQRDRVVQTVSGSLLAHLDIDVSTAVQMIEHGTAP